MSIRAPMNLLVAAALAAAVAAAGAFAQSAPPGYPASYAGTIAAAKQEGKLVIYSSTDLKAAAPLVKAFEAAYPNVKVEYNDMNSTEIYNRFIAEAAAGQGTADVLWSSAMELQLKLASGGYAMTYESPELPHVPKWANYRDQAFGTTFEPVVFVYNKRLFPAGDVPHTHAEFAKVVVARKAALANKVTLYDIEKAGVGFTFVTHDSEAYPGFWELVRDIGATGPVQQSSTGTMLERISSGENLLGYNILGSYAIARAEKDPAIGVVLPKDYMLALSRISFIAKAAKHPNAAKLWTDFVLSKKGQEVIANECALFAMRPDVTGKTTAAGLKKEVGDALRPIPVDADLLKYLDPAKRLAFLKQWRQALGK
jgi:iron(III) transport system substrate-binding protein